MSLSRAAVRRPVTTAMIFLALVVLGIVSWRQLPVQLLPDFTVPTIGVYLFQPGASGSETLDTLTKPAEAILAELPRVKRIRSWSGSWGTWIRADFEFGADIRFAAIDLQERLNAFQSGLQDRRTRIEVYPFSTEAFKNFLMEVALEGPGDDDLLRDLVRDRVEPQLETVSGVARVEIGGLTSDAAEVILDPARLSGYRMDFGQVFSRIQTAGLDDDFLGELRVPGETHFVRMDARVRTLRELAELPVDDRGVILLGDVAEIVEGEALEGWIYRSNGRNALGLQIEREEGENLIRTGQLVRERIDRINKTLPEGTRLRIETDIAEIVEDVIDQVQRLALQGAALALLVPLIFFRSWRIAAIIFVSVPICIIAVFNLFRATGMSINVFSIIGLALGVGMLVDNSIVVVENCFRLYFSRHLDAAEAASRGGGEVGRALFASTLTTCVPFLALFFVEGDFRLYIREPALALTFPLMLSLLVALSLSAMMTSRVLQSVIRHRGAAGEAEFAKAARRLNPSRGRMREFYRWLLKGCIRHRGRVLLVIAVVIAFTWLEACGSVRQTTADRGETRDVFRVYLETPPGTKTSETAALAVAVEDRLTEHEDIEHFAVWIQQEQANFDIRLKESDERPSERTVSEVRAAILDFIGEVPGARVSLEPPDRPSARETDAPGDRGQLVFSGLDLESITPYAERVADAIEVIPEVTMAQIAEDDQQPEYHAVIDREKTRLFNIDATSLGQYVGATRSSGAISSLILRDEDERTDVTISIKDGEAETIDALRNLPVYTPSGSTVPFSDLTLLRKGRSPSDVRRENRQSSLLLEYFWAPGSNEGRIKEAVERIVRAVPNPAGVVTQFEGQQLALERRDADFRFVLLAGVMLIYVVMAAVFESFWVPFTILLTNPLMLIGIVIALAITGLPFEELAGFGVILLNGLAVNNGIVLMDAAMRYRNEYGYSSLRAIFQAADQRLRPIVMTFLTTFFGLLPMALTGDEESQWRPVAVTVLGGLTSATFLTLLVLPCFYLIGEDFVRWARPGWLSFLGRIFRGIEITGNGLSNTAARLFCFWTWKPLTWPVRAGRFCVSAASLLFWRFPRTALRVVSGSGFKVWRFIHTLAGDARFITGQILGHHRVSKEGAEAVSETRFPGIVSSDCPEGHTVETGNLWVLYPKRGLPSVRRLIPSKGIPIGHRPRVGFIGLQAVSIQADIGLYGLLGPNGAGKTTLLRCLAGLQTPTRGSVRIFGIPQHDGSDALAPLIGYLPQTHGHYDWMKLSDYLDYFAILTGRTWLRATRLHGRQDAAYSDAAGRLLDPVNRRRAVCEAAESVTLDHVLDEPISTFSGGMRQRAGIARVLLQSPPIIIVDEPTAGLDPVERVKVRLLLSELARTRCVLFSTHIVEDLEGVCSRVGILSGGRLLYQGGPEDLKRAWEGRVWEVPVKGHDHERVREDLLAQGAGILFRYAAGGSEGWRCMADTSPDPEARSVRPTLEDALLGTLRGQTREAKT